MGDDGVVSGDDGVEGRVMTSCVPISIAGLGCNIQFISLTDSSGVHCHEVLVNSKIQNLKSKIFSFVFHILPIPINKSLDLN